MPELITLSAAESGHRYRYTVLFAAKHTTVMYRWRSSSKLETAWLLFQVFGYHWWCLEARPPFDAAFRAPRCFLYFVDTCALWWEITVTANVQDSVGRTYSMYRSKSTVKRTQLYICTRNISF